MVLLKLLKNINKKLEANKKKEKSVKSRDTVNTNSISNKLLSIDDAVKYFNESKKNTEFINKRFSINSYLVIYNYIQHKYPDYLNQDIQNDYDYFKNNINPDINNKTIKNKFSEFKNKIAAIENQIKAEHTDYVSVTL